MRKIKTAILICIALLTCSCAAEYTPLPELTYPQDTETTTPITSASLETTSTSETSENVEELETDVTVPTLVTEYTNNPSASVEGSKQNNTFELLRTGLADEKYQEQLATISDLVTPYGDQIGFVYLDITSGDSLEYNADTRYPGASLVKAPFVKSMLATNVDLDMQLIMSEDTLNSPSELLLNKPIDTAFPLRDVLKYTIKSSSNTGYNMLLKYFGYQYYNSMTWSLGLNSVLGDTWKYTGFTARQMTVYFKDIYYFTIQNENGQFLKECMMYPNYDALIGAVVKNKDIAQKYGYMPDMDVNHNCSVVYGDRPYVICIMTGVEGQRGNTHELIKTLALEIDNLNNLG